MSQTLTYPTDQADPANAGRSARWVATHRKLLEAGMELFAATAPSEVTSTAIARRAGVATGTFYLHFDDKHALFDVLVDEALAEIRAQFPTDPLAERTPAERRAAVEAMVAVVDRRRDLIRAVFDRDAHTGYAERIQDRIATGIEDTYREAFAHQRIALHPGAAAQARAAVLVRVIAWWAEDPTRATRDEIVDVLLDLNPLHHHTAHPSVPLQSEEQRP